MLVKRLVFLASGMSIFSNGVYRVVQTQILSVWAKKVRRVAMTAPFALTKFIVIVVTFGCIESAS